MIKELISLNHFINKHMDNNYNTTPKKKPRKVDVEQLPIGGIPYKYEVNRGLTR